MKKTTTILIAILWAIVANAQLQLPKVFSSNMVLQRNIEIPVWGKAEPNTTVSVTLDKQTRTCPVDAKGEWKLHLPSHKAGGPFTLTISNSGKEVKFENVLIGDVWFAGGQSNMEWQVQQAMNADTEIPKANYPNIRLFFVEHAKSLHPAKEIKGGKWEVCDSSTVKTASAVAYYFAKDLHKDLNVPIGILQSTWGGTPVEAWTSREMLLSSKITRQRVMGNDTLTQQHFIEDSLNNEEFWKIVYNVDKKLEKKLSKQKYNDSNWPTVQMPKTLSKWGISPYEGMIWMRKTVSLTKEFTQKEIEIELGLVEMNYSLYVNGKQICKNQWNANLSHRYKVPKGILKKGKNTIVLRVAALWGGGGINTVPEKLFLTNGSEKVSLAGDWNYQKDLEPHTPKIVNYQNFPTFLYNAMIAPVIPYGLKGFIWYQGEANENAPRDYRTLFPMLINDWRIRWQQGNLPFFHVQLANFMKRHDEPTESKWAEVREAQTMALSLPNVGQACIIDLGEAGDIHPKNKHEVGRRLALSAKKVAYGKNVIASGPMYKSHVIEGGKVRVQFTEIGTGLSVKGASLKGFAVAGKDKKLYWAEATIKGNEVVLTCDKVKAPVAVRYAWADNPEATLFNKEGLPAVPFRTDVD